LAGSAGRTRSPAGEALAAEVEATLAELEEAEALIRRSGSARVYIEFPGGVCVEVSREEALEYIGERRARLRAILERLRRG
jgi:prefoldin subunit 5